MGKRRQALGRGLDAIIPSRAHAGVTELALDDIVPSRSQPRTIFDDEKLKELADSIRLHGIIQPLIVSPADGQGKHRLVAGERRWQAARTAGLERVPVVERAIEERGAMEIALVENIQREDLSPLEEASAFDRLARDHGLTQQQIADHMGRSRSAVANTMRLLTLPVALREALADESIREGHARALLGLEDPVTMEQALGQVVANGLNVRQTEALVARLRSEPRQRTERARPTQLIQLEQALRDSFGTRVSVVKGRKSGRIVIEYYSDEELQALTDRLLGQS